MKNLIHNFLKKNGFICTKESYRRNIYGKDHFNSIKGQKGWILINIYWNRCCVNGEMTLPRMDIIFHEEQWTIGVQLYSGLIPISGIDFDILLRHVIP